MNFYTAKYARALPGPPADDDWTGNIEESVSTVKEAWRSDVLPQCHGSALHQEASVGYSTGYPSAINYPSL
jgi:hypothetical protein